MTINRRSLYELTAEDRAIFQAGALNPNILVSHYVDTPDSGTWYVRDPRDERHRNYEQIYERWLKLGEPEESFQVSGRPIEPRWGVGQNLPDFLHRHGFTFIDWQQAMLLSAQRIQAIVGGYGSAKTTYPALGSAYFAVMLTGFEFLCLAPLTLQAKEMYNITLREIQETPFGEKFLISYISAPYPTITIGHADVGYNKLTFMSGEDQGKKTKTLEKDWIVIDQAEDQPDLFETSINLRTRLRGMVRGRPRMCRITYLANSGDNDDFWAIYDRAVDDPDRHISITVSYDDNPYLTEEQRADFRDALADDPELIDQHLHGHRVEYSGDEFPKATIRLCRDETIEDEMERGTATESMTGYEIEELPVVGIHRWTMPYDSVARYAVFADGGQGNPPKRNAGVIVVLDIGSFPDAPAKVREFHWVFGHGSIMPFLSRLAEAVTKFKAHGHVYFDATGPNKGLAETFQALFSIGINAVDFSSTKYYHLNSLKVLMTRRMIVFPWNIRGIRQQFGKYKLPDDKIAQDIVSTFLLAAAYLQPMMRGIEETKDEKTKDRHEAGQVPPRLGRYRAPRVGRGSPMSPETRRR